MRFLLATSPFAVALLAVLALVVGGGAAIAQSGSVTVEMGPATGPDGGGDQAGTATLTAMGSQTEIVLSIDPSPDGASVEQPVHVHAGTCDNIGAVEYPLNNVVNGASTTLIDATLESLQTGDFSINAHKSAEEIGVYVSCGDIPAATVGDVPSGGGPPGTTGGPLSLAVILAAAGALAIAGGGAAALAARRIR